MSFLLDEGQGTGRTGFYAYGLFAAADMINAAVTLDHASIAFKLGCVKGTGECALAATDAARGIYLYKIRFLVAVDRTCGTDFNTPGIAAVRACAGVAANLSVLVFLTDSHAQCRPGFIDVIVPLKARDFAGIAAYAAILIQLDGISHAFSTSVSVTLSTRQGKLLYPG